MQKRTSLELLRLGSRGAWCLVLALLALGCAHQTSSERSEPQQAPSAPAEAADDSAKSEMLQQPAGAASYQEESAPQYAPAPPAVEPKKSRAQSAPVQSPNSAVSAPKPQSGAAGSPRRSAPPSSDKESLPALSEPQVAKALGPTASDSEGLRAALVDFEQGFELLSTGISCDDGCRALASMDRAKSRICTLANPDDLLDRCAAAEQRLEASRALLQRRCGSCP
jgi:hypothetical protein